MKYSEELDETNDPYKYYFDFGRYPIEEWLVFV